MDKKVKFENFLESLKGNGQDKLIESVKKGFQVCFENEVPKPPTLKDVLAVYSDVDPKDVKLSELTEQNPPIVVKNKEYNYSADYELGRNHRGGAFWYDNNSKKWYSDAVYDAEFNEERRGYSEKRTSELNQIFQKSKSYNDNAPEYSKTMPNVKLPNMRRILEDNDHADINIVKLYEENKINYPPYILQVGYILNEQGEQASYLYNGDDNAWFLGAN